MSAAQPLLALVNGRVLADHGPRNDLAVLVRGGRIEALVPAGDPSLDKATRHDLQGRLLLPGFIDVQVNGGGGLLFNAAPTVDTLRGIAAAHRRFGTTGMRRRSGTSRTASSIRSRAITRWSRTARCATASSMPIG